MHRLITWFFPAQASNLATSVDSMVGALLALCGGVTALVMVAIVFFCVRYRRGSKVSRAGQILSSKKWEISWTVLPLFLFCVIFAWAAKAYYFMSTPPTGAEQIYVVGKQWMWKVQHEDGRREINELHIPRDHPVKLMMTSEDVIHDFYVPAFRTKEDVLPGRYTTLWFTPTRTGIYHLFCSQYCGMDHARMGGCIYVMEPQDYAGWLERQSGVASLAAQGEKAFHTLGCSGCHAEGSRVRAPLLQGIYGKTVPLADGTMVFVDEQYLRDSILLPNKQIAAGFEPVMPAYQNHISAEDLNSLIAYLKSSANSGGKIP